MAGGGGGREGKGVSRNVSLSLSDLRHATDRYISFSFSFFEISG